ncbi:glutaredoxin 3 [Martelella mediterranea]|uniref:Glutaredoxin n=1 Tax=Martelella mediterranea DSM 17316 TaxID=1122214 RepID=A0A1U9Z671_9HYPH|nr:glutaredoxin 3 [Martelella mediterranea]AQZ53120.1 Glutaredoxin-3 [Martelella mediterranea DSM 17316]
MANIDIYTRDFCGFCARAKSLLDKKGVAYTEFNATETPDVRAKMIDRAGGRSTFPQIFIGDRHIGGCDDLYALDAAGQLDPLLAA